MNLKLIALAAVAVVMLAGLAYIYKLRADIAGQDKLIAEQAGMIALRDAAIDGYKSTVASKDQEIKAMADQSVAIRESLGEFQRRVWSLEDLLADAKTVPAKPGEVLDDATNRKVVNHLNSLVSLGVRETASPQGNPGPNPGKIEPLPQAVFGRPGPADLGTGGQPGPRQEREDHILEPGNPIIANSAS